MWWPNYQGEGVMPQRTCMSLPSTGMSEKESCSERALAMGSVDILSKRQAQRTEALKSTSYSSTQIAKFMGAHLGPVGLRWAPFWPHEPCYQGPVALRWAILLQPDSVFVFHQYNTTSHTTETSSHGWRSSPSSTWCGHQKVLTRTSSKQCGVGLWPLSKTGTIT